MSRISYTDPPILGLEATASSSLPARPEEDVVDLSPSEHKQKANPIWEFLHELQVAFMKMISGALHFLFSTLPCWLYELLHDVIRISIKGCKVGLVATAWLLFVFGPMLACSFLGASGNGWAVCGTSLWSIIIIYGSGRTLARMRSRRGSVACVWVVVVLVVIALLALSGPQVARHFLQ